MAMSRHDSFEGFKPYTLDPIQVTDRELGRGSYAAVMELEYRGLKCAGKKIHQAISSQGVSYALCRFAEECHLLSQMRHPNVVQFLGVCFEREVSIPILVMEFLPTNLSSCIDRYCILPQEISYSILHDVSLGLNYLHSQTPPIIHRDLSANNILLSSNMTAKISDLGVAKILNLTPLQISRMTETPGTPTYMPPEVMVADPNYNTGVDVFSYGIMMIHVFSGKWPHPNVGQVCTEAGGRMIPVSEADRREEYLRDIGQDHPLMDLILRCISNHPPQRSNAPEIVQQLKDKKLQFPPSFANKVEMLSRIEALEEEKRGLVAVCERLDKNMEHMDERIKQLEEKHTNLKEQHQTAVEHLELAHSTQVVQLQSEVKDMNAQVEMLTSEIRFMELEKDEYEKTVEAQEEVHEKVQKKQADDINKLQSELNTLRSEYAHTKADMEVIISSKDHEIATRDQTIASKDKKIAKKSKEIATMTASLKRKDAEIASKKDSLFQKDDKITSLGDKLTRTWEYLSSKPQPLQAKILWTQCKDLPVTASSGHTTIINNKVYYGGFVTDRIEDACTVYCYDPSQDTWSSLPQLPVKCFGLGQVRGQLVALGGQRISDGMLTADVTMFDEKSNKWKGSGIKVRSLPTARWSPAVISHPSALIVASGSCEGIVNKDTVEIFNTEATSLIGSPWQRTDSLPAPACHNASLRPVIVGCMCYLIGGNDILCASVDRLLKNAKPLNQAFPNDTSHDHTSALKKLADTPNCDSAATVLADYVLSIGGSDKPKCDGGKSQSAVHMYSPSTNSWIYITDLPSPRHEAAAAVLSPREMLVIGGRDGNEYKTNNVFRGTLSLL